MKLTANTEWVLIGALIAYIAFTPGLPAVRDLLSSGMGKALALGLVVYVWKFVSQPVAILLVVALLRCMGVREGFVGGCPAGYTQTGSGESMTCKNQTGMTAPPVVCAPGQTWDATTFACTASSAAAPAVPPGATPGPTGAPPTTTPTSPTGMTGTAPSMMPPTTEGFQPNSGKGGNYAPA